MIVTTSKTPLSQIYPTSIPEASGKHLGIGWSWCPISLLECWQCIFATVHSLCRNRSQRTEKSYLSLWDRMGFPNLSQILGYFRNLHVKTATLPFLCSEPPGIGFQAIKHIAGESPCKACSSGAAWLWGGRGGVLAETHTPKATGAGACDCVPCNGSGMEYVSCGGWSGGG